MEQKGKIEVIYDGICHLGEGPVWNVKQQKLYWTDIFNKRIFVYDYEKKESKIFWEGEYCVGGFAFTRKDDIVLCTNKGVFLLDGKGTNTPELLFKIPFRKNEMFNDITVDPAGRIFAGTLDRDGLGGTLYRLEKGKDPVVVMEDIKCSNGMGFSTDNKYFYHTDSTRFTIKKYVYDIETGEISKPVIFYLGEREKGLPDGMTVDSENHVWSAFWGSYTIKRFNPEGEIIQEIRLPAKQVSSVMFGGSNMTDIFVTSSCQKADNLETGYNNDGAFLGGPTYLYSSNVKGREEFLADF